jgi:hypothetical protein
MRIEIPEIIAHIKGNRFIGLSVFFLDDEFEVVGCELVREKEDLDIVRCFRFSNDFGSLKQYVSGFFPVVLSIDGKGILHKKIPGETTLEEGAEGNFFPGIDLNSFWIQRIRLNSGDCYLSVGRKKQIDSVISGLKTSDFHIIGCTLGPFVIENFLNVIVPVDQQLDLGNVVLTIHQESVQSYHRSRSGGSFQYFLQEEAFDGEILLPFCLVMASVTGILNSGNSLQLPALEEMKVQSLYKRRFFRVITAGGLGTLLILLVNFLMYSRYSGDLNRMIVPYNQNKKVLEQLNVLELELEGKNLFMKKNNLTGHSAKAWYCDRIASLVTDSIDLERMVIAPVKGNIRESKQIRYNRNTIRIEGIGVNEKALSSWVALLDGEKWVKDVIIEKFIHDENKPVFFILKVDINISTGY